MTLFSIALFALALFMSIANLAGFLNVFTQLMYVDKSTITNVPSPLRFGDTVVLTVVWTAFFAARAYA